MSLEIDYKTYTTTYNQLLKDNGFILKQIDGSEYQFSLHTTPSSPLSVRAMSWESAKKGAAMFIELRKLGVSLDLAFMLVDGFIEQVELLE
jgi:hypothetical protein